MAKTRLENNNVKGLALKRNFLLKKLNLVLDTKPLMLLSLLALPVSCSSCYSSKQLYIGCGQISHAGTPQFRPELYNAMDYCGTHACNLVVQGS